MNDHKDFFVSSTSTTASSLAAHPLQVFIMRQCAANSSKQEKDMQAWRANSTLRDSTQASETTYGWDSEGAYRSLSMLLGSNLSESAQEIDVNLTQSIDNYPPPSLPCPDAERESDPLTSVSRKIMDLMCDVVPELPSKLPMLNGQSGDAALQQRISELIRQQLRPGDAGVYGRSDMMNGPPPTYDTITPPDKTVSHGTSARYREPRRYLKSCDARELRAYNEQSQQQLRDTSSAPETMDLAQDFSWMPRIQCGGTQNDLRCPASAAPGSRSSKVLQHRSDVGIRPYCNASLQFQNAKDECHATMNDQSRQNNLSPSSPPWWSDNILPPSDSPLHSEQYGRDYGPSNPLNSEASPCTSTTAGMSDEGLSAIMAEFVLQEFLRSQAGGNGSMSPSDQDCSPKSNQSLTFTSCTSQGSPIYRDYLATSPIQSASSGRNERPYSDLTHSGANKLQRANPRAAASALLAHDLRLGVFARNVDRESLLTSPSNQSQSSLNFNPRPQASRTPLVQRGAQRRSTLLGAEPLLPRSPPGRARQVPRRSVELTHSQAMLAMAAAARRNNCAYSDDHDRMIYISWIPKQSRAYTTMDRRRMELELKKKLREEMHLEGVTKVLLFPPKGAHCKLIFDKRASAEKFMEKYGGDDGSEESERWKHDICAAFGIIVNERFAKTVVKIEWSQK